MGYDILRVDRHSVWSTNGEVLEYLQRALDDSALTWIPEVAIDPPAGRITAEGNTADDFYISWTTANDKIELWAEVMLRVAEVDWEPFAAESENNTYWFRKLRKPRR